VTSDDSLPDLKNIIVAGPYCGIYSLCACLDTYNIRPPVPELFVPDFVGSYRGSTAEELIKGAEKYGVHGKCYYNMTWRQLQEIEDPMILHFRGGGSSEFNHWVAFLGIKGNHVRIVDAPHELAYLTMAELLAQWDGIAVLISKTPIQDEVLDQAKLDYFWVVLIIISSGFLYKTFYWNGTFEPSTAPTYFERWRRLFIQTVSLCAVCGFVAIVYHALSPIGFLKNPSAVAEVTRRYYAVDVPEISVAEMKRVSEQKSAIVFDARYHNDFESGAIGEAISLPINSDLSERKQILRNVDRNEKIVVYCQSSACPFSDNVATFLKFNGYNNVSIYRGGYREWEQTQNQLAKP
jgi:rhodanese-related sulfurtransferase